MNTTTSNTADREVVISRLLNAPIELVWEVWTNPDHIKNWWGPNGFTNTINKMDVAPNGQWNLIMHGPDGTDYDNESIFTEVEWHKKLVYRHISIHEFTATILFEKRGNQTHIHWQMLFDTPEELIRIVKLYNISEGLQQNVEKLDAYLKAKFDLQKQLKPNKSRVSTYLNFPRQTEEAFGFYQKVFNGKLLGEGFKRFGDIEAHEGMPPLSESDKKLILHVELEIMGGHILKATDAPESFGFTITLGNNMHINIEPESREETKRIFDSLSAGGTITMELQDMFWGAYYGSCTDKYGVNWMVNYSD